MSSSNVLCLPIDPLNNLPIFIYQISRLLIAGLLLRLLSAFFKSHEFFTRKREILNPNASQKNDYGLF